MAGHDVYSNTTERIPICRNASGQNSGLLVAGTNGAIQTGPLGHVVMLGPHPDGSISVAGSGAVSFAQGNDHSLLVGGSGGKAFMQGQSSVPNAVLDSAMNSVPLHHLYLSNPATHAQPKIHPDGLRHYVFSASGVTEPQIASSDDLKTNTEPEDIELVVLPK